MNVRRRPLASGLLVAGLVTGAAAVGGRGLLRRQAASARELIGKPLGEEALAADRTWKKKYGDRIDLLVLGDSIAAGLGAEQPRQTLGARLARKLAKRTHRAVRLHTAAVVGAESSALAGQLAGLPASYRPDVAVVIVGGNDVTHRVPVAESVEHLTACVRALRERGTRVVVGTCPDLGALRPIPSRCACSGRARPASWPRRRPGRCTPWARTWCPWPTPSARSSPAPPRRCSASTGSIRRRWGTSAPRRRCFPTWSRPWRPEAAGASAAIRPHGDTRPDVCTPLGRVLKMQLALSP